MPNLPQAVQGSAPPSMTSSETSIHFETVSKAIPAWLRSTSMARVSALKNVRLTLPDWHKNALPADHHRLKNAVKLGWNAQNDVDKALRGLQDVKAFAKPLLQQELKKRFSVEVDVEDTWLRLYEPVKSPWWVHDFESGTRSRTLSLLDAALHNFSSGETFSTDSEFITRPNAAGHFDVKTLKHKISIEQFKSLCRELNIGARYEKHLNEYLLSTNSVANNVLRHKVILSQKSTLNAAARMALMKHDIDQDAYEVVQGMLDDRRNLHWQGQPVSYYNLCMMDASLTGVVLITPDVSTANAPVPVIAYIPHDPEHPLKQYASSLEFMGELTRQLRDSASAESYQQFFSQFVDQQQRGHFFSGLNDRLSNVKWHPAAPGTNLPSWRETPVDNPNLQFDLMKIQDDRQTRFNGDLWRYFYRQKLNKILNDAREIAISTEYADRMARWAWWDNLEKILSDMLNAALLVVTPLVPGLGELMLLYTGYQLTDTVVEGIVDLAEGHLAEAGEQVIGMLENIVQLGVFAAGGAVVNIVQTKLSPFFESLKPVQLANGETRLWNPDLSPYQRADVVLPVDARPDGQGIHPYHGRKILRLNNQHFEVLEDPITGQQRIRHPERFDAYAPTLRHNGQGAWVSETENPREWEGTTLMRRLGHTTDAFSDAQLEEIRQISGTDETELRRMHIESAPPPPLLTDTLQHLGAPVNPPPALSPEMAELFSGYPELPETVAEKIFAGATRSERQQMTRHKRLPLRLKIQARELQFETQAVRAAHGLYDDALVSGDTERLVLGTLRMQPGVFGNLRIEIRQGALDGELRCSAGPEDAEHVQVMVRDESGKYEVRDAENRQIHAADDLLPALLQAMGRDGRRALGYRSGDTEFFKQWIIAKIETPSERRTVLATPPIRTVAEHETMLLVRGAGTSRSGATLHERIHDLHPHFSDNEVDVFARALIEKGEPMKLLDEQEKDILELRRTVEFWQHQFAGLDADNPMPLRGTRLHIAERLLECVERKNRDLGNRANPDDYALDLSRELLPVDLEAAWPKRAELKNFLDKVTVLKLDNTRFKATPDGLLKNFPNLRQLSARRCELKTLPDSIGAMHRLERLQLSDNAIVLDTAAVLRLKPLTFLEILRLDNNPLAMAPDIGRMPRLKLVALKNTGLTTWPDGTLAKTRPRGFLLDLRDNPLSVIPQVVPGRPEAWVIARTRLNVGDLSEMNQLQYQEIRRSVGLPPEPLVISHPADYGAAANNWADVPGFGVERIASFRELSDDPRSHEFIEAVLKQENTKDFATGGSARQQLVQRMARMIDAVYIDTQLREQLYTMASAPVDCADAGAQLFNSMGIRVLASEAYSYTTDRAALQRKLVTLAKGAARLDHVNEIARADVASRGGDTDEVEVYLAYQTGLAQRLNLPWQSEGMLYRAVSDVTDSMINQAYDTALALGEGDGLINTMLEQDFWERYLRETWPTEMEANKRLYQRKYEKLETLRTTQLQWLEATSDVHKTDLRNQLKVLMNDLPAPETVIFADEPISEAHFDRMLTDLGDSEKELARRLTREALRKAGQ
ncbi:dermonecrotic toxin domain-containing protein [Pseudomonas sp. NFX224]|uniref:dermonecrotic toxin domain-containing protein n=1 Tax=Pseudomonas sp. NFX224 TaxID=3402862 RepID=UPI003AFB6217